MGMHLLRRRDSEAPERVDDPRNAVYRVEVDSERHRFHEDVPYSFWSSAKTIFILSVLLWWLPQSAGYMVAGYVGGRRAGSPWKGLTAALIPVIVIFGISTSYAAGYGRSQIDFLAGVPTSIASGIGSTIPFLEPYAKFVIEYLTTFVAALQTLFGMGTNGYMVTIAFAYIGGIVADQTRREIASKGTGTTSVNIVQPILERLHRQEPEKAAIPARAHWVSPRPAHGRTPVLSEYHKVPAGGLATRHGPPPSPRHATSEEREPVRIREPETPREAHHHRDSSAATQRFVERALRDYEKPRHARHSRD